jgi:hypothetical protein
MHDTTRLPRLGRLCLVAAGAELLWLLWLLRCLA